MQGYTSSTYGNAFADVYDEWYADLGDVPGFTSMAFGLALAELPVLELGVGSGRLAGPLAAAGLHVVGIDSSAAMLAKVPTAAGSGSVTTVLGDMVEDLPDGPFGLAFCGFNTFFNLLTEDRQQRCLEAVGQRLAPGACLIIEASIPSGDDGERVTVRSMTADAVVLSISRADAVAQTAEGHYVSFTEAGGVRLRPWAIRWCTPGQLDEMAQLAGLELIGRYADHDRSPLTDDAAHHVSVFRRPVDS